MKSPPHGVPQCLERGEARVHVADPVERLAAVRAELQALKASKEAMAAEALTSLGRFTPFPLASWWVRLAFGLPQREIVTVTTNVPGPRQPLYGMGRRLLEIIPYVPIATTLRTGGFDLHLLRQRHLRDHRRLRRQPRPVRAGPRHRRRYIGTEESRSRQPSRVGPAAQRPPLLQEFAALLQPANRTAALATT